MAASRVLTRLEAIQQLLPAWRELVANTPTATIFQTPEWALYWWQALSRHTSPFCLTLTDASGRLVGLVPLCIDKEWGARVVRFMATPLSDSNRILVEPSYELTLGEALADALKEHGERWDVLHLTELSEQDSCLMRACQRMLRDLGVVRMRPSVMTSLCLPEQWSEYLASLSAHRRKRLRGFSRGLETCGAISFHVTTEPQQMAREIKAFVDARNRNWKARRRWRTMAAVQRSPGFEDALTEACVTLAERRQVWLTHLDVNATPVAWGLAFFVNGTLSEYMTTYDLGFSAHSPGQLRLLALVKYAMSRGIRRFDMGRGEQAYKCWFGATAQSTRNVLMYVRRPRIAAFVGRHILRERVGAVYERAVG